MPKVLILMPLAKQRGGGELMLMDLLRHAPQDRIHWVVVFFERGPLIREVRHLGIDVHVVKTSRLRQLHRWIGNVWQLASLIRKEAINLVLSWSAKPHLYGGPAAWLAGIPATWYQLGYPVGRHLGWMDRLATLIPTQAVITLSKAAQQGQKQLWPSRPTHMVYPSVRMDQFDPERLPSPSRARRQLGLPEKEPLIGIVGRLQRWKGMHTLVNAMPRILEDYPDAHAVIVGGQHDLEPDYEPFLDQLIKERGLSDQVIRAGFQSDVPLWMQAMDVVVHASDHEPFGIVIIEAMALGKPVVAGDQGGPTEIITDGKNGLLAPYEDPDLLAQQILRYLQDSTFAERTGQQAQARAQDFSPQNYANRLVSAVRRILKESEPRANVMSLPYT
jgi:glycosyltransferase involved in cell wall biosynthesis